MSLIEDLKWRYATKKYDPTLIVEEEDDSKYQWLGFKASLDDDEPIVKKSTLSTLVIPE